MKSYSYVGTADHDLMISTYSDSATRINSVDADSLEEGYEFTPDDTSRTASETWLENQLALSPSDTSHVVYDTTISSNYSRRHTATDRSAELDILMEGSFARATEEHFEDGMESVFSKALLAIVKRFGDAALEAITYAITSPNADPTVSGESLRCLGRMDDPRTDEYRRWLLERCLFASSALLRDGAILGLASMDDRRSVVYVKEALIQEKSPGLREDLKQLLDDLETTE